LNLRNQCLRRWVAKWVSMATVASSVLASASVVMPEECTVKAQDFAPAKNQATHTQVKRLVRGTYHEQSALAF
jgi:hypothetical protein